MPDIWNLATRALRLLPPEIAHNATLLLAPVAAPLMRHTGKDDPRLAVEALGLTFSNPIGLAPGYDKDARVFHLAARLGFGFVEVGTLTPRPQSGNPRPRIFRLGPDRAVINRLGFNNWGIESAARRLGRRRDRAITGINIGANRDSIDRVADYVHGFERLAPLASYVAVNISSPNTPGLRDLQKRNELLRLLGTLADTRAAKAPGVPLLVKIAPDLSPAELDGVADAVLASGIEGVIVSNTTTARPATLKSMYAREPGGLSGAPLFTPSTIVLKEMRQRLSDRALLVGVGGVSSGADAYAKIRAGAGLVQLYTALSFEGPGLVGRIKRDLLACLDRDGFRSVREAIGADLY